MGHRIRNLVLPRSSNPAATLIKFRVSYICVVLYNLFYIVLTCMISCNLMMVHFYPCNGWGDWVRVHLRSGWSREYRGAIKSEAKSHPMYCVLCQVWEHCFFHVVAKIGPSSKFTEWQNFTLVLQSCHWVRSPLQEKNTLLDPHPSWSLFLHTLHPLRNGYVRLSGFWMCKHQIPMHCSEL